MLHSHFYSITVGFPFVTAVKYHIKQRIKPVLIFGISSILGRKVHVVETVQRSSLHVRNLIVCLSDSESNTTATAKNPLLGDILSLISAALYVVYITLIRKKLPGDEEKNGGVSMAQFLGFLGLFNFIFLPGALILNFTKQERFNVLTWKQFGLVFGKGLLDNVISDYLWAKAVLLTTTTGATAGLTIQVPLAAIVDKLTRNVPTLTDYIGALAVMVGFAGINIPFDVIHRSDGTTLELESRMPISNPSQIVSDCRTETTVYFLKCLKFINHRCIICFCILFCGGLSVNHWTLNRKNWIHD